jgi:hypothetical protein
MMRRVTQILVAAGVMMLAVVPTARAQGSFDVGTTDVGPVVGFGGISGGTAIGGRAEFAIKELPDLNNGILSIAVGLDHYSYDCGGGFASCNVSTTPIGATVNYHFRLDSKQWDPFIGIGLGDTIVSCSVAGFSCGGSSVYFIGRIGVRYYISRLALYADTGTGEGALHVGVMFKIK